MDLQRLQVVITAKTQELQKQIKQVVDKLNNVNTINNSVEDSFKSIGNTGSSSLKKINDAYTKIIASSKKYIGQISEIAKYNSKYDIWGGANKPQPWTTSKGELLKNFKI